MAARERPLSPHLQVYKPQITSTLSIIHRITGVVLAIGALFCLVSTNSRSLVRQTGVVYFFSLHDLPPAQWYSSLTVGHWLGHGN